MPTTLPLLAALLLPSLVAQAGAAAPARDAAVAPRLTVSYAQVPEGDDGMTMFTVAVEMTGSSTPIDVQIFATAGTANETDFLVPAAVVRVSSTMPGIVTGYVLGDRRFEETEYFTIFAQPVRSDFFFDSNPGTITIVDDDAANAPHVSAAPLSIPEGNAGWRAVQVPLRLDKPGVEPIVVFYASARGVPATTAVPWGDYRSTNSQVTFNVGQTIAFIPLEVNGDTAWEPDTTLDLVLSNARGGVLDTTTIPVTLVNDDRPAVVTIEDVRVAEGKDRHAVSLRAVFAEPAPPLATVRVAVVGGTARSGEDFVGTSLELHPSPGATSVSFAVTVLGDATPECDEGIIVEYQGVLTGDDTKKQARILLVDDDGIGSDGGASGDGAASDGGGDASDGGDAAADGGACADPFATRSVPLDPGPDAGPQPDAGPPLPVDATAERPVTPSPGGCDCALAGADRTAERGSALATLGLLLALALRRSTTRSRHSRR